MPLDGLLVFKGFEVPKALGRKGTVSPVSQVLQNLVEF
jgi:hypothetical protein